MPPDGVYVVLSTYNGARYVESLIQSIQRQTFTSWRLLVRDDGSSDATVTIIERLARDDSRITLLSDGHGNLRAPASFGVLLAEARDRGARYVFLADQDDVWLEGKLARLLASMRDTEARVGSTTPVLVYSDLTVVSDDLQVIHPSFRRHHGLRLPPAPAMLPALLAQNTVTGCASVLNRALLEVALPVPARVAMHDWWIAQCAAATGTIVEVDEATVLYRQHAANVVGSKGIVARLGRALQSPRRWWEQGQHNFLLGVDQANALQRRVEKHFQSRVVVEAFCGALGPASTALGRLRTLRRLGVRPLTRVPRVLYGVRMLCYDAASRASSIGS